MKHNTEKQIFPIGEFRGKEKARSEKNKKELQGFFDEDIIGWLAQEMNELPERKELVEKVDSERNFNIEVKDSDSGVILSLAHKETKKERKLNSFLPPEHFFERDKEFFYSSKEKKIAFPENEIKFRGFLLSLFHEIGHAHEKIEHPFSRWEDIKAFVGYIKNYIYYMKLTWKQIKEMEKNGLEQEAEEFVKEMEEIDPEDLLPLWYLDKLGKYKAKIERNAWAYALRALRKLQREGFNVFSGFKNVAEIKEYIAYCLYTHDLNFLLSKIISSRGELKKIENWPIFHKRGKKLSN